MADIQVQSQQDPLYNPNLVHAQKTQMEGVIGKGEQAHAFGTIQIATQKATGQEEITDLSLDTLSPAEIKNIIAGLVKSNVITEAKANEISGQIFRTADNPTIPDSPEEYHGVTQNVGNQWFNSNPLVAMSVAFAAMWKTGQMQKLMEKDIELKERGLSFSMAQDSAKLQIDLGKLKQEEHMFRAMAIGITAVASAGAAFAMPAAGGMKGASMIGTMEIFKGLGNAATELVSGTYAPLQAAVEAAKTLKDAIMQQMNSFADNSQQASKEQQDLINQLMEKYAEIQQRLKDAFTPRA